MSTRAGTVALVRRPSPRLAEGIVTHLDRQPVDYYLAMRQWDGYVAALRSAGWATVEVPPADDCPDSVFVEDTMVVYQNVAVIARLGADARRAEVIGAEKTIESLGYSVNRIHPLGTLDGGDVLKVGDTVYVGRGGRTNAAGIAQLRDILTPTRCSAPPTALVPLACWATSATGPSPLTSVNSRSLKVV